MYEQQNPFKLSDFINMSNFINLFLYKAVIGSLFGKFTFDQYPFLVITFSSTINIAVIHLLFMYQNRVSSARYACAVF